MEGLRCKFCETMLMTYLVAGVAPPVQSCVPHVVSVCPGKYHSHLISSTSILPRQHVGIVAAAGNV